jgi:hypothetical protein
MDESSVRIVLYVRSSVLPGVKRGAISSYQIGGCFKGGLQILK